MRCVLPIVGVLVAVVAALGSPLAAQEYVIGPGDTLRVTVLGEGELTRELVVDSAGRIVMPLAGEIAVAGLKRAEAAEKIRQDLGGYVKRPEVTVEVVAAARKGVVVAGSVRTPGAYLLERGARLMDAIAAAGGSLPASDLSKVKVTRAQDQNTTVYDLAAFRETADNSMNPELESGDIVTVSDSLPVQGEIYIWGEVAQRGPLPLREGMTVRDAIGAAGGMTANADPANATIKRMGQPTGVPVDIAQAMQGDPTSDIELKTGDWLFVPTVQQIGTFSVLGEVNRPGTYPFQGKVTVTDAIAQAGGLTQRAKASARRVSQTGEPAVLDIGGVMQGTAENVEISPGDTVYVDRRKERIDPLRVVGTAVSLAWLIIRAGR